MDERLRKSPKYALDYLNTCLEDPDPGLFLLALRDVARAYGGMTKLAQKSSLNREALYHALGKRGNPTLFPAWNRCWTRSASSSRSSGNNHRAKPGGQ